MLVQFLSLSHLAMGVQGDMDFLTALEAWINSAVDHGPFFDSPSVSQTRQPWEMIGIDALHQVKPVLDLFVRNHRGSVRNLGGDGSQGKPSF